MIKALENGPYKERLPGVWAVKAGERELKGSFITILKYKELS